MGNRLSKIYTRTGDDGTTGLGDGSRTDKDGARVAAYGTTDELNSVIGVVLSHSVPAPVMRVMHEIQHHLFPACWGCCSRPNTCRTHRVPQS